MQPPEEFAIDHLVFGERAQEAAAGSLGDRLAAPTRRFLDADGVQDGGDDVDHVTRRVPELATGPNPFGPMHHQRSADAAFVDPGLVTPKRRVGGA